MNFKRYGSCEEELRVSVKRIFTRGGPLLGFHSMVLWCGVTEQQQLWCVPSGVSEKYTLLAWKLSFPFSLPEILSCTLDISCSLVSDCLQPLGL